MFGLVKPSTYLVDFETLADGRVSRLLTPGLFSGQVLVPDLDLFNGVTAALLERARSTRAALEKNPRLKLRTVRAKLQGDELIQTARRLKAHVITTIRSGVAAGDGITRIDDLFEALKPIYLPGAELFVKVVKRGKESDEGIAFLEGGIKVVIDDGAGLVGKEAEVVIQGALDTAVGRVVFARPKYIDVK